MAFILSGFIYFTVVLKEPIGLDIGAFLSSLLQHELHRRLFLALLLIAAVICMVIISKDFTNEYKSDMQKVTDNISIPVKAGQAQHGSARFMTQKDIEKNFCSQMLPKSIRHKEEIAISKGGLIIGYESKKKAEKVYILDDDIHTLILVATRSGKTRGLILQSVCLLGMSGENMVISDPKGEIFDYTTPYLRDFGYEIVALDFRSPSKSNRYNFLQTVVDAVQEGDLPKAIDAAWDIADVLVKETKEKVWSDGEKSVIAGAILSVVYDNSDKVRYQDMATVYSFINRMSGYDESTEEMHLKKYMDSLEVEHPAKEILGVVVNAPARQRASYLSSALATLRLFTNPNIRNMTAASDFDLKGLGSKKRAMFLILPDEKNTFHSLASLFVQQQYTALVELADSKGGRLPIRCNFLLDEFGNFTKIPNFVNFLTVGGGRGIRFNLVIQSFAMLDEKYGKEGKEAIKDNCQCLVYLASSNQTTLQEISQRLGKYTVASFGKSSGRSGRSTNVSSNQSQNLTSRDLLTSTEVSRLERPFVIVLKQGKDPAIMQIPDISQWRMNLWLGMGDETHNTELRMFRQSQRPERAVEQYIPCDTWDVFFLQEKFEMPQIEDAMYLNDGFEDYGFEE